MKPSVKKIFTSEQDSLLEPVLMEDTREMAGELLPNLEKDSFYEKRDVISSSSTEEKCVNRDQDETKPGFFSLPRFFSKDGISSWMKRMQIISRPKRPIQPNYEVIREWILLNEAHGLQVECDKTLSQQLVVKLIDLFDREQKVMHKKEIHTDQSRRLSVRMSLLSATVLSDFQEFRGSDKAEVTPVISSNDCSTITSSAKESVEFKVEKRACNRDQDDSLDSASTDARRKSTVGDDRKFGYPFVESVDRMSCVGLPLDGMDPLKFLELEVHYVQASLEAQEVITGELHDIHSDEMTSPGWNIHYIDGTSKIFWKHQDGRVALDPPLDEYWVLLADPLQSSNPFPYPKGEAQK